MMIRDRRPGTFSAFGQGDDGLTVEQLMQKYENARLRDVPAQARDVLFQYAAQFDRGFSQEGPIGVVLVPWPLDRLGPPAVRTITVRRTAAERAKDLPGFRAPAWDLAAHGDESLVRFNVSAQKDWGVLGTGITAKTLTAVAGVALSAVGLGVVGAALGASSKKTPTASPLVPSPSQIKFATQQQAAQQGAPGTGTAIGVVGGAGAGFLVGGPAGAVVGAAAGYLLGRQIGQQPPGSGFGGLRRR